jgi:RNA polymerase sigma factor (sigma-70 family)
MSTRDDRELVPLAQRGDAMAVGELFSRYWRAARAAAFGVTRDFASAEDAASDGFRDAFATLTSLRDADRFGPWLRTIVVRKALAHRRDRHDALDGAAASIPDPAESIDDAIMRREFQAVVQDAIRRLPDHLRESIALFYFEGYDSDAAARFLDIPAGTLRRRLHDGRAQLRCTVDQILQGAMPMSADRQQQIDRLKAHLEDNHIYEALRGAMALRPVPRELVDTLGRHRAAMRASAPSTEFVQKISARFGTGKRRASDPHHPVGAVARAIRNALPDFTEWTLDVAVSAGRFFDAGTSHKEHLRSMLPPGFAEGRPGSFIRAARGLIYVADGSVESVYDRLKNSPTEEGFLPSREGLRVSDVLDLTWMTAGALDLRAVQDLLDRLVATVLPGIEARFSAYDEPRYRSALQLHLGTLDVRAAQGGVLREWPGRPQAVDAAHLRLFLEPWAWIYGGQSVEFESLFGPEAG